MHFAAVASDAAARVEVLTAKTTGDCHIFNLNESERNKTELLSITKKTTLCLCSLQHLPHCWTPHPQAVAAPL